MDGVGYGPQISSELAIEIARLGLIHEASETAAAATTRWPARARAAPSAVPARPAPTMPTASRAGRPVAGVVSGITA